MFIIFWDRVRNLPFEGNKLEMRGGFPPFIAIPLRNKKKRFNGVKFLEWDRYILFAGTFFSYVDH